MKYFNLLCCILVFASCSTNKITSTDSSTEEITEIKSKNKLVGKWILEYMSPVHGKTVKDLYKIQKPYLNFVDDTKVAGNNGCNNIAGAYKWEGSFILFETEHFRSTRMFCEGVDEKAFLNALQTVNQFTVSQDENRLILMTGDIVTLSFIKEIEE